MKKTNHDDLTWTSQFVPGTNLGVYRKNLSQAVGGIKDVGTWGGGQPFDVELVRLPAGGRNWPLHSHAAQWEAFLVVSGDGMLQTPDGATPLRAGDYVVLPPGEPHAIQNDSSAELTYYVIADNPRADVIHYPETNRFFVKPQRLHLQAE